MDWYLIVWLVLQALAVVVSAALVVETHRDTAALRRVAESNGRWRIARRNARRAWMRLLGSCAFATAGIAVVWDWRVGETPVLALALILGAALLTFDAAEDWWSMRRWEG